MRPPLRHLWPTALAAVAVLVVAAPAPAAPKRPATGVRLVECAKGRTPQERYATFRGVMRRVVGTQRMWIRFSLEERIGDGTYRIVKAPGLGVWRKSRPLVRGFAHKQTVVELAEGGSYRALVRFRWYDAGDRLIRRAKRRSPVCRQPAVLPNLRVRSVGGSRIAPDTFRYAVQIVNRGRAPATGFGVRLAVNGGAAATRAVGSLAPGSTRKVFFTGPPCTSGLQADVDPANTVRESDELDNSRSLACPARR